MSLGIPTGVSRWEQMILGVAFVGLSAYGLMQVGAADGMAKTDSVADSVLFADFCGSCCRPRFHCCEELEIPQNRYSSGVLAVMHSAQYLWITSYYARREASGDEREDGAQLASAGVFRCADRGRHRAVCSGTVAGEPGVSS